MLSFDGKRQSRGHYLVAPRPISPQFSVDGGSIIHFVDRGLIKSLKFPTFWFEPTPQGLFMLNIAFGQSKYFVDNLRENVKRGLRQKITERRMAELGTDWLSQQPKDERDRC